MSLIFSIFSSSFLHIDIEDDISLIREDPVRVHGSLMLFFLRDM